MRFHWLYNELYFAMFFCVDNEHSGREPERGRRLRLSVLLSAGSRHEDDWFLKWQQLGPVCLSLLADQSAALVYIKRVDVWNSADGFEPLRCSHLPDPV